MAFQLSNGYSYPAMSHKSYVAQAHLISDDYYALAKAETTEEILAALTHYFDVFDGKFAEHMGTKEKFADIALTAIRTGDKQPLINAAYLIGAKLATLGIGQAGNLVFKEQERIGLPVGMWLHTGGYQETLIRPYYIATSVIPLICRPPKGVDISGLSELAKTCFSGLKHSIPGPYLGPPVKLPFDVHLCCDVIAPLTDKLTECCFHTFYRDDYIPPEPISLQGGKQ